MWQIATIRNMATQLLKEKKVIARINVRIDQAIKDRIAKAAHILGQDITEFTVSTLHEKAREVVEKHDQFILNEVEKNDLFALLDGAVPEPTERSLKAVKRYKEMVKEGKLSV